jgi:uncharacterized protein YggE
MKKTHFFALALVAVAIVGCVLPSARQKQASTVTVSGVGTVSVAPDMVSMTVSMSNVAKTTREAQEAVGRLTAQVLAILKEAGIEDKDIQTASLRFNPEYDWRNNRRILVGQSTEQSIAFAVRGIGEDAEKAPRLIDRLSGIDGITMNQMDFGTSDNTPHFVRSRELAFEKARQKAEQYASLAGMKVGRVLSVSEDGASPATPLYRSASLNQFKTEVAMDAASTVLPSGQMEITTRISAVFLLE